MGNLKSNKSWVGFAVYSLVLVFGLSVLSSGCEPLRKKFTRQKKKDKEGQEFVPVLDPVDYPDAVFSAPKAYQHHLNMWKVWYKDLSTALSENAGEKRLVYLVDQLLVQLGEMQNVLTGEKKSALGEVHAKVQAVRDDLTQPAAMRSNTEINRRMKLLDKQVRNDFDFSDVENDLVKPL